MFVGHALLAFAIAASVATYRGWSADRALAVGLLAGLFGTLPDIDMAYAFFGLVSGAEGLFSASDAFWAAAAVVHRAVTHSLVLGVVAAVGFAAWRVRSTATAALSSAWLAVVALSFGVSFVAVALTSGPLAAAIVGVFLLGGLTITGVARLLDFGPGVVLLAALLGLLSHPFGDLFTGAPPQFLYPIDVTLLSGRVLLHPDPTLHLLGAFFFELATIWLAVLTVAHVRGWQLLPSVRPRAALGLGYAGAVFAIPAPTLQVSWPFVFTVLCVGLLAVPLRLRKRVSNRWYTAVTALTAVTLAALAYAAAYLVVG